MNTPILRRAMQEIPSALGAGLVDINTGLLLDVVTMNPHPREVLDLVAAATKELFEGKNVKTIERLFRERRKEKADEPYFKEFITYSTNLVHYFCKLPSNKRVVAVFICGADVNIGMMLLKARTIVEEEKL